MRTSDFSFQLPEELIAHYPATKRSDSRLLCLERQTGEINHRQFNELPALLQPQDLLVFNNTRVIPARLYGTKQSGGKLELLIERILDNGQVLAQIKASKSPKPGTCLLFPPAGTRATGPVPDGGNGAGREKEKGKSVTATVLDREDGFFKLQFQLEQPLIDYLEQVGHMPLPPYIKRQDRHEDRERYQTIYSDIPGAVAAPTAGLHFDEEIMQELEQKGIETAFVTLHVGAGTFQPVRVDDVKDHRMHSEWIDVPASVVEKIHACRKRGGRVVAVGTTTVRSLESAANKDRHGELREWKGETDIFIYPGFEFRVVDAMITNFHLPESTLLMLVSAFAGKEKILDAYHDAVTQKYRFFSYGDAMFIS